MVDSYPHEHYPFLEGVLARPGLEPSATLFSSALGGAYGHIRNAHPFCAAFPAWQQIHTGQGDVAIAPLRIGSAADNADTLQRRLNIAIGIAVHVPAKCEFRVALISDGQNDEGQHVITIDKTETMFHGLFGLNRRAGLQYRLAQLRVAVQANNAILTTGLIARIRGTSLDPLEPAPWTPLNTSLSWDRVGV